MFILPWPPSSPIFIEMNPQDNKSPSATATRAGAAIKKRRLSLGIDQRALSEISGVAMHTLSNLEAGNGNPTVRTLERVLAALGMELRIEIKP